MIKSLGILLLFDACVGIMTVIAMSAQSTQANEIWPQWRGPQGQGHASTTHDLPISWSESENIVWKTPLQGRGWSSPVLDNRHVWITTAIESEVTEEQKKERLAGIRNPKPLQVSGPVTMRAQCIDKTSGRIVHDIALFTTAEPQPIHSLNSYASPSPVLLGKRLFCHFGDYGTVCLNTQSAHIEWINHDIHLNHENGPGSTPVLWKDLLIVHCDGSDTQSVVGLNQKTGSIVWKTARSGKMAEKPDFRKAYGTPVIVPINGNDTLLSPAADWLYAYQPATGQELWKVSYEVLGFSIVPRPVVSHGMAILSTSFMKPELLAIDLGERGTQPAISWRQKRGAPSIPSPLVVSDRLYVVSDKGIMSCFDVKTGEEQWASRLGGNFSSSPLFADGRIYVCSREGTTFVIQPGSEFELLSTNQLDGQIFATPAAINHALYLRTDTSLYRIEKTTNTR